MGGKDMGKHELIEEKVLEYWFTLEFLGQDKYPQKELIDAKNNINKLKKRIIDEKKGYKSAYDFIELKSNVHLYQAITSEAEKCHMTKWGNITVYIGKVKRESCIKCIEKLLPTKHGKEERPERNLDNIACASLQLTPEGKYIEHSLSLSTIVWAMKQIKDCHGNLVDFLDEVKYKDTLSELENKFFPKEEDLPHVNSIVKDAEICKSNNTMIQKFCFDAVTIDVFQKLYQYIEQNYLIDNIDSISIEKSYEYNIGISFQLFADDKVRNKEEDDNYLGLNRNYFADDLKMILNKVRHKSKVIPVHLIDYIKSPYHEMSQSNKSDRYDLIQPKSRDIFENQLNELLNIKYAPDGKWPSRFLPSLMQQIAINLAIKKGDSKVFNENESVFSVNGPPGTGKTTLLKEIIVHNIVERASLLANYESPDNAFIKHDFRFGDKHHNAYSCYTQHWYSFKDDKINDYSVLVTSCNNTAVENISKELPIGSKILGDLKTSDDDSDEIKVGLNEIKNLFDFSQSIDIESFNKGEETYPDLYFTKYAQNLLDNKDAWGLIATALGKKKNIQDFYKNVLNPLKWDFYPKSDSVQNRLEKYREAKKNFLNQKSLVKKMQNSLSSICDIASEISNLKKEETKKKDEIHQYKDVYARNKIDLEKNISNLQRTLFQAKKELTDTTTDKSILVEKIVSLESLCSEYNEKILSNHCEAVKIIESVGKKPLLFGKKAYEEKCQYAKKAAADFDKQANQYEKKMNDSTQELNELKRQIKRLDIKQDEINQELSDLHVAINEKYGYIKDLESNLLKKQDSLDKIKKMLQKVTDKYNLAIKSIEDGIILNEEFINDLLSDDEKLSTEAQVKNPWFTSQYNREREKLFFYALKLNKEFILASKKCRDNFTTLSQYWGLQLGDDKERIIFHEKDRRQFVSAVYQTLFLLVPVISTTFASAGTFLKDVRNSGIIGTLIIDEAGQAQPYQAVGALYRSRKAVIVGDPKQVEPVVTDDLRILKRAFDDVILKPYIINKNLSVQSCADNINAFGTYLENPEHPDYPDWIGCPLLVHRRCISPMFDISNKVSYHGIMKQKTIEPKEHITKSFIFEKSQWIQINGIEKGNKNHFVETQAKKVCEMLEIAFRNQKEPSVYIITPFTTVVAGMRDYIKTYKKVNRLSSLTKMKDEWLLKNIGTVHTFQGKEANEVIFLLGCDKSKDAEGAVNWVNSNIVNVAVTRAKYRLYIIGDAVVWCRNQYLQVAKHVVDTYAIKEINSIIYNEKMNQDTKEKALREAAKKLPSITSFPIEERKQDDGDIDFDLNSEELIKGLEVHDFMKKPIPKEQLYKFGFTCYDDLLRLNNKIRKNVELGIRLYYCLEPIYKVYKDHEFDASCCAILFCKAMELQMNECFKKGMQRVLGDFEIIGHGKRNGKIKLKDTEEDILPLGTFGYIIKNNVDEFSNFMAVIKEQKYNSIWWSEFNEKLNACTKRRNMCCHSGLFAWRDLSYLLADMFKESESKIKIGGLMFESEIGKKLYKK